MIPKLTSKKMLKDNDLWNICTDTKDRNADLHLPVETRTWNETQLLARARKAKIDRINCKDI